MLKHVILRGVLRAVTQTKDVITCIVTMTVHVA